MLGLPLPSSPAALRNREPVWQILKEEFPASGTILEVASGMGEHVCYFAQQRPSLFWQPSDPSPDARDILFKRIKASQATNIRGPLLLDASLPQTWPSTSFDGMLCINMVHISPWAATCGLLAGAGHTLASGAALCLYGPYRERNRVLAASNAAFDSSLTSRNAQWGLRWLRDVVDQAETAGLRLTRKEDMPSNNLLLVFRAK